VLQTPRAQQQIAAILRELRQNKPSAPAIKPP
jgi:hypothetical protein